VDNERIIFLIVGVVIVVAVGRLLARGGRRYLANSAPAQRTSAGSSASLVTVLFHLLTLGLVALLAVLPIGGSAQESLLVRVGVLLIALAAVYGIALGLLSRRRQEAIIAEINQPLVAEQELRPSIQVEPLDRLGNGDRDADFDRPMNPGAGTATGYPRPDRSF
jgi:hypothetical protein